MNEFEKGVQKIKMQIAEQRLKNGLKKGEKEFEEIVKNLKENAKAFMAQQSSKSEKANENEWLSNLSKEINDGWHELEESAKNAWKKATESSADAKGKQA